MIKKGKVIFRRIGGRIVPILDNNPTAAGVGIVVGTTWAAPRIRRAALKGMGNKKNGSMGALPNVAADLGISYGLNSLIWKNSTRGARYLDSFLKLVKRSV